MIKVNSISGGKTSAFMALNYPADIELFALVCIEAEYCKPKDKGLVKYVSDKIGRDFVATAESDKTLIVVRDLEQILGKEIKWVVGDTFDELNRKRKSIPNRTRRFCTAQMKIHAIAKYLYENTELPVFVNMGIRYDEKERAKVTKQDRELREKIIVGKRGTRNKWEEIFWGVANYPLLNSRTTHYEIYQWAKSSGLDFPDDSNCVGCFWKPVQQLRKNWDDYPNKMEWFAQQEEKYIANYKDDITYRSIKKIGLQTDFFFGTGSGCQAGFCTD